MRLSPMSISPWGATSDRGSPSDLRHREPKEVGREERALPEADANEAFRF
jgi:hypothetical protein